MIAMWAGRREVFARKNFWAGAPSAGETGKGIKKTFLHTTYPRDERTGGMLPNRKAVRRGDGLNGHKKGSVCFRSSHTFQTKLPFHVMLYMENTALFLGDYCRPARTAVPKKGLKTKH